MGIIISHSSSEWADIHHKIIRGGKVKVKLSLCLTTHRAMKIYLLL